LHLFSASPELVNFARGAYRRRSEDTSLLLAQLIEGLRGEGLAMAYTMEDFKRQYIKDHFAQLTPEERREALKSLPAEELLAVLSADQIRQHLEQLTAGRPAQPRKPRRRR
jgi:hypothetical protein